MLEKQTDQLQNEISRQTTEQKHHANSTEKYIRPSVNAKRKIDTPKPTFRYHKDGLYGLL
ncbi:hypothetical protein [Pedobacter sp. ASV28]|jgi:hypothetical protein|uniref:hypothetical protein n=1 Tax=Pedobacter sp. ASV28 TaxID=2795123 RepID=UPI0018EAA552|nr:hypothetical protein [Pedobacter sp. ASV28]